MAALRYPWMAAPILGATTKTKIKTCKIVKCKINSSNIDHRIKLFNKIYLIQSSIQSQALK